MRESNHWLHVIFHVGVGIAALALSWFVIGHNERIDIEVDVLIAITTALLSAALFDPHSKWARETQERYDKLLDAVADSDIEHLWLVLRHSRHSFTADRMPDMWLELLWRMRHAFCATSYVALEHWPEAYPIHGSEIQRVKAAVSNVQIRRIFIVETPDEVNRLQQQANLFFPGIQLKYIHRTEIEKDQLLREFASDARHTIDFGLFDNKCVFLWHLDKKTRDLTGGRIDFSSEAIDEYQRFFDRLSSLAHVLSNHPSHDLATSN
jgi:hypothetical protein